MKMSKLFRCPMGTEVARKVAAYAMASPNSLIEVSTNGCIHHLSRAGQSPLYPESGTAMRFSVLGSH